MKERNEKLDGIPKLPGVYIMRGSAGEIIYIGKAKNLRNRISSYFNADIESKSAAIISAMRNIDYILAASERESLIIERDLINKIKPHFNAMWKDDKSYPYIQFTAGEDFPRLFFTRKKKDEKSLYFGPYPQIHYIKKLLRRILKLFKIRHCRLEFTENKLPDIKKVKSCIYYHIEQCPAPCMGKISSIDYKEKIKGVKDFLEGKFKTLSSNWKKEMQDLSAQMLYEEASQIRDNLYALEAMAERVIISEISVEDIEKSIFKSDSLKELQKVLHLDRLPSVIEGFDNSNMQGKNAVSSMVRFFNGSPDKQNYRKFKIKTVIGADDFASIYEVVFRRYSALIRKNEKMPDLVVIDGGKGQLSFAKKALDELKLPLPLISLAKRNEEIFMPFKDKPLVLNRNSPALNLLQNVRDEAHRFAINYHRFLRKKSAGFENKK